jgi:hypothetical protein
MKVRVMTADTVAVESGVVNGRIIEITNIVRIFIVFLFGGLCCLCVLY